MALARSARPNPLRHLTRHAPGSPAAGDERCSSPCGVRHGWRDDSRDACVSSAATHRVDPWASPFSTRRAYPRLAQVSTPSRPAEKALRAAIQALPLSMPSGSRQRPPARRNTATRARRCPGPQSSRRRAARSAHSGARSRRTHRRGLRRLDLTKTLRVTLAAPDPSSTRQVSHELAP